MTGGWQALAPVELPDGATPLLDALFTAFLAHPHVPSAISSAKDARDKHVADSLAGLAVAEITSARLIADLGSGAGFPGLALAAALPASTIELLEASTRKGNVAGELAGSAGIGNVRVIDRRSEEWAAAEGRERYDAVTARAVGTLAELCELASPLLARDGVLVAWKGARDESEESVAAGGSAQTAMQADRTIPVIPYPGSRQRHLHVYRKIGPTPADLPRRPGQAHKRPLGT